MTAARRATLIATVCAAAVVFIVPAIPAAAAQGPAPCTEDADRKIDAAFKAKPMPPASPPDHTRTAIDWLRAVYHDAGYDYDATIRQMVQDLGDVRIPDSTEFVYGPNLWMLSALLEQCAEEGIACRACFPSELAPYVCLLPGADGTNP